MRMQLMLSRVWASENLSVTYTEWVNIQYCKIVQDRAPCFGALLYFPDRLHIEFFGFKMPRDMLYFFSMEKEFDEASLNRYLTILEDSLAKKNKALDALSEMCGKQEEAICGEKLDVDTYNTVTEMKGDLIENLNKLDDGFAALHDRVFPVISKEPKRYADHIRRMQDLIAEISEKTILIEASERRLQARLDRLAAAGRPSSGPAHVSPGTAAQKYHNTMNVTGSVTSVFVDNKRKK